MKTLNLSLFYRSLYADNRNWRNYLMRTLMLFLIGGSLLSHLLDSLTSVVAAPGLDFFHAITMLNFVFITTMGVALFSSAVTEEKEVDSLYLLLMTGVTPFSLLVSKGGSKFIIGLMLILAQLPYTLLAVSLGGISFYQVVCVYVSLIAYTFFLANLALFFSVITNRTYKAATLTLFSLVSFLVLGYYYNFFWELTPFYSVSEILTTGFKGECFNSQVLFDIFSSFLLFFFSFIFFNSFTREKSVSVSLLFGWLPQGKRNSLFRIPRTWSKALAWKEFYFVTGGKNSLLLVSFSIIIGSVFGFYFLNKYFYIVSHNGEIILVTSVAILFLQLLYVSSNIFSQEIIGNNLQSLFLLPLSLKELVYQKIMGSIIFLLPSIFGIIIGGILYSPFLFKDGVSLFQIMFITFFILNIVIHSIFYFYLVVYSSLFVRYGAFAVAGIVWFVLQFIIDIPALMLASIILIPFYFLDVEMKSIFNLTLLLTSVVIYLFAIILFNRLIYRKLKDIVSK